MTWLLQTATRVGDLLAMPFGGHAGWALVVFSVLFAAAALLLFKVSTRQRQLATARGRLIGRLYEAALYQTSLTTIMQVQFGVLRANLRYLRFALPAVLALIVPLLVVIPQLETRLGRRSLDVGETALVTASLTDVAVASGLALQDTPGVRVEAGPVRDRVGGTVTWRLRALQPGAHGLRLTGAGDPIALDVPVALSGLPAISRARHRSWWQRLLHDPGSDPLSSPSVSQVAVSLPARDFRLVGVPVQWLVAFSVLAIIAGLLLRSPLRVEL